MNKKEKWLRNYMADKGLSFSEIDAYIALNKKCNFEGMIRAWRKQADPNEKNYEREKEMRMGFSPAEQNRLKHKEMLKRSQERIKDDDNNLTLV